MAAGVVIAVTVGVTAYGLIMGATLMHSQAEADHLMGWDRDSAADASTAAGYDFTGLASNIDEANATGHEVVAVANAFPLLPDNNDSYVWNDLVALYGDVDWSPILVAGSAPGPGEIAVNAQWASTARAEIGDTVVLQTWSTEADGVVAPFTFELMVSGITRSPFGAAGVSVYLPGGFVSWDDIPTLNQASTASADPTIGVPTINGVPTNVSVSVYGNGNWPWTEDLAASAYPNGGASSNPAAAILAIAGIGVGALLIGLFAMAFALGRAQAQARTKWVGTVRAMGATKRQVAWATMLESASVGVAAGLVGFVLGALGATAHLAIIASRIVKPMVLPIPGGYAAIAVGSVALAVVLSTVVGAVPAFWSARVSPTAALKPVNDVAEATVSRSVRVWPLAVTWLVALGIVAAGLAADMYSLVAIAVLFAGVVLLVTTIMLANEALRHSLPWRAKRMSQSQRRAVMVAGDAILARPRQSTVPAFVVALATAVYFALIGQLVASWSASEAQYARDVYTEPIGPNPYLTTWPIWGTFAVVTLICVAIAVATASVSARDAATREALGLTRQEGRLAAALQYLVAQAHGLALGLMGAVIAGTISIAIGMDYWFETVDDWIWPTLQLLVVMVAIAAFCAFIGATIVGAFAPKTAPLSRVEVSA
jgi:hypothetical protein